MTWQAASIAVLVLALGAGFAWFERSRPPSRVVALVASLAALAVVGRLAFAPLPNVKPATTDVILFAGYALGAAPGFMTGAIAALVSNFFFEQGAWTPWQMAAWAAVGVGGAVLARLAGRELGRWPLAVACALAGLAFGAVMDTFQWTLAARQDLPTWLAVSGQSLPYNLAHAIGNFAFCLALGPAFVRSLQRFRRRFEFRWVATGGGVAGPAALVLVALAGLALPAPAGASTAGRALGFLRAAQNGDGGFGAARGSSSSQQFTAWAALGMAAAGRSPDEAGPSGRSAVDFIRAHAGELDDTGELERTIVTLRAAGISVRHFAGRDLLAELHGRQDADGSFGGLVNHTAFGVLALKAAGSSKGLGAAINWLARQQAGDGGFGFAPHSAGDADDTGVALEALAAGGRSGKTVKHAVRFLHRTQHSDGGFGQYASSPSNAQSTAWAVQGLVAVGRDPDALRSSGHTPLSYLRSLARADGSIRYSRSSAQTPVWVTAQALAALERRAFPIRAVKPVHPGTGAAAAKHRHAKRDGASGGGPASGPGGPAVVPAGGSTPAPGASRARSLRRAADRVDGRSPGPSPVAVLLLSGLACLALAAVTSWRGRRRAAAR
jgi:energy-coupling factor transport system substrate-specific component